ncbi:hypothetical protein GQ457_09G020220 [Hibiscus cannabinus]
MGDANKTSTGTTKVVEQGQHPMQTSMPMNPTVAVSHNEKPSKFTGQNFKTWQQKMLFYLTMLNLAKYLSEDPPVVAVGDGEGEDRFRLGLRRLIGSRHQSSRPQGWKRPVSSWPSSVDRVKTSIFPTSRMEECRPVSSWPSSVDRVKTPIFPTSRMEEVKTPIFPTSRMEECRPVSSWPSSFDRVKTSIFPTSRMEECRPVSSWPSSVDRVKTSIFPTSRMEECLSSSGETKEDVASSQKSTFVTGKCFELQSVMQNDTRRCFNTLFPSLQSIFPQAAMKQTDWICQLNDFGRKGPESATTYYFRLKFCLIPSGAKEQTQRIESFDLASSGSKEQIKVVTQCPWMRRNRFGQIKIGAFWSLPDSRFSAMCKEGQL